MRINTNQNELLNIKYLKIDIIDRKLGLYHIRIYKNDFTNIISIIKSKKCLDGKSFHQKLQVILLRANILLRWGIRNINYFCVTIFRKRNLTVNLFFSDCLTFIDFFFVADDAESKVLAR